MSLVDFLVSLKQEDIQIIKKAAIVTKWRNQMFSNISEQELNDIYFEHLYWHICSYNKVQYDYGDKAIRNFESIEKNNIYIFYQDSEIGYKVKLNQELTAERLEKESDIYIVDENFSWTYVVTHEKPSSFNDYKGLGPYFIEKQ